jgi:6-phosphofructokinase 1
MLTAGDLEVKRLGPCTVDSPLFAPEEADRIPQAVGDEQKVLLDHRLDGLVGTDVPLADQPAFELAGPRRRIYFDPAALQCGIVTCGGLCPGLNDVIRGLVMVLRFRYGVSGILGFRYGYEGLSPRHGHEPMVLTPDIVESIHEDGGTILGTSRGEQDIGEMVDCLQRRGVSVLFTIGGDGTQRGGHAISQEALGRGADIAVVGVPKTIDDDILFQDKSFGFETAYTAGAAAIQCAHTEARAAVNGIGLVKLMGRDSGAIACHGSLASGQPNIVLIPEVPFDLDGEHGLLAYLHDRLERRRHACIVVAEGAGQDLIQGESAGRDASGNVRLKDIGFFLKERISRYLTERGMGHTVKYIDPSAMVRSLPATPDDSLFCLRLAQDAAHAAMAGRTDMVIGRWNGAFVHIPMPLVTRGKKRVDPAGEIWQSVLELTGQPTQFKA